MAVSRQPCPRTCPLSGKKWTRGAVLPPHQPQPPMAIWVWYKLTSASGRAPHNAARRMHKEQQQHGGRPRREIKASPAPSGPRPLRLPSQKRLVWCAAKPFHGHILRPSPFLRGPKGEKRCHLWKTQGHGHKGDVEEEPDRSHTKRPLAASTRAQWLWMYRQSF